MGNGIMKWDVEFSDHDEGYESECNECGGVLDDGDCWNSDCSLSPDYSPPTCYSCGEDMNMNRNWGNGECENTSCRESPDYEPPTCGECGQELDEYEDCTNTDCPASSEYEEPMLTDEEVPA